MALGSTTVMKEAVGQKRPDRLWHSDMTSCALYSPLSISLIMSLIAQPAIFDYPI
ncbi:MAG: hypothetical protein QOH35_5432 [Acidobacteriaceae bacterium]|nr:hypothetical protein [Acidobacteriaceae bacterium]